MSQTSDGQTVETIFDPELEEMVKLWSAVIHHRFRQACCVVACLPAVVSMAAFSTLPNHLNPEGHLAYLPGSLHKLWAKFYFFWKTILTRMALV